MEPNNNTTAEEAIFRLQVVSKRQMTLPVAMMKHLRLNPGDFIDWVCRGTKILNLVPLKTLPVDELTEEQLEAIETGRAEIEQGRSGRYGSVEELSTEFRQQTSSGNQKSTATATYRLQIVGPKRQMTVPTGMMDQLRLSSSDFIEVRITGTKLIGAAVLKTVPVTAFDDAQLQSVERGRAEIKTGRSQRYESVEQLARDVGQLTVDEQKGS